MRCKRPLYLGLLVLLAVVGQSANGYKRDAPVDIADDAHGHLIAYTNAAGQAFRLTWDAQGRLLAATNAFGEEVQRLAYDEAGNLVERVDGAGRSAVFAYDCLNRATNAAYADGANLSFAFDAAGSLIRAEGPGATNTFGYGTDGAMAASTSTAGGVTFEVRYLRDVAGNVTNLIYPDGRSVAYEFDAENRLAVVRDWNGRAYGFERDGVGRVTSVAFPNGVTNAWTRDQAGRVTGWRYEKSGTALMERNFTLDAVGRILEADYAAGPVPAFPAARRLDYAHNAADRITGSGIYSGTNVESSVWLYDGAGAVTNGGGRSYAYGARGLLEQVWGTNVDFEAAYDALGNRIWERSGGVERRFAVNHADPFKRPLVETDASGTVVRRYLWGPDRLLAVEEVDGTLRVALTDERGSVAGLADEAGALTDAFVYGPYGEDWGQTGTNDLAFRWLGGFGVRHAGGSLYVTRFRAYDADARRFLSADPLGLAGGGNLYAYGAGDPMFFIDPLGLEAERNGWGRYQDYMTSTLLLRAIGGYTVGMVEGVVNTPEAILSTLLRYNTPVMLYNMVAHPGEAFGFTPDLSGLKAAWEQFTSPDPYMSSRAIGNLFAGIEMGLLLEGIMRNVTAKSVKYHYKTAPESSFHTESGLWKGSSVTDKLYTDPLQASQELGITGML